MWGRQDLAGVEEAGGRSLPALEICILISFPVREHALCQPKPIHRKHAASAWTATAGDGGGALPLLPFFIS